MPFTVNQVAEETSGVILLAADGEAVASSHDVNPYRFDSLLGPSWTSRTILLDFEHVTYLDSAAVGWLIASQKSFRAAGGKLILHSPQPQIRQLLAMLKIERIIPIAADLAAARNLLAFPAIAVCN